jgi:type IV secretion system protein VirD4
VINTAKIKKYLLPNLPYFFLFWLFGKCGEAYRLAPGGDALRKFIAATATLNTTIAHPMPSLDGFDLLVGLLCTAAIYCTVQYKKRNAKKWRRNREYGSARWGGREDIAPFTAPKPDDNIILTATESLMLSGRPKNPKHARNKNVLIVGGSGSGKTRFWLKPNLLQLHSSYCITDPKGQILVECGNLLQRGAPKTRVKLGKDGKPLKDRNGNEVTQFVRDKKGNIVYEPYQIKVLNTIDFKKSLHYNPFAYIKSEKDILKFVTALIANTKGEDAKSGDDFWQKAEVLLYCALIGFIYYEGQPEEKNMNTLVRFINAMEVREDDETYQNGVDLMFERLKKREPDHFAVRQYAKFKLAAGKTSKSILISCGARLAPFDIAELRNLMAYDEMELDTIGDRKTALFIIISDTDTTFNFVAALMYSQLFNILCDKADSQKGGRLRTHVRFLLDEFANIGTIPHFDKLIATIRSREISACVILQTQSQLKNMYKDNAETIIGNMDSRVFLGGSEKTTLKDLSESLGKETIDLLNHSVSKGNSPSFSQNYQKLARELMSIDELSVMDGSKCVLQLRGVRPFLSEKYDLTKHKNYKYLSDFSDDNIFDIEAFINTKLKVKETDEFAVFNYAAPDDEIPEEAYADFGQKAPSEPAESDEQEYEEDLEAL